MRVLVVGGTSGLGLCLARRFAANNNKVTIAGRTCRTGEEFEFQPVDFNVMPYVPGVLAQHDADVVVWAAGFYQSGKLHELASEEIAASILINYLAPALHLQKRLLQGPLQGLIAITSSSEWTPREKEPMYCSGKAALAMLARSVSLDPLVGRTLVAAPQGMATPFWHNQNRDLKGFLDPEWVADRIMAHFAETQKYRHIRILRDPARVEVDEDRTIQVAHSTSPDVTTNIGP
jgi:NAD(P)-dependent dehydrogenase (short-subunit alcohol dehydrogenase family)